MPLTNQYCRLQLPEHLKNHHKTWSDNRNEENSIEQHKAAYNDIRALMTVPMSMPPILVAPSLTLDQEIDTTRRITPTREVSDWHVDMLLGNHMAKQSATQFNYGERPPPHSKSATKKALATTGCTNITAKKRKPRTCMTCKRPDCQGAF